MDLSTLPLLTKAGAYRAVIETPRGAGVKLAYDPAIGTFEFRRALTLGVTYPYDWGFFPSTKAPDGDPLDVLVWHDASTSPGVVIPVRLLGVLRVSQKSGDGERERNDRVIAVPIAEHRLDDVKEVPPRIKGELGQFFLDAVLFEGKELSLEGWGDASEATKLVERAALSGALVHHPG